MKTKYPRTYLVANVLNGKWLGFSSEHNSWINANDLL